MATRIDLHVPQVNDDTALNWPDVLAVLDTHGIPLASLSMILAIDTSATNITVRDGRFRPLFELFDVLARYGTDKHHIRFVSFRGSSIAEHLLSCEEEINRFLANEPFRYRGELKFWPVMEYAYNSVQRWPTLLLVLSDNIDKVREVTSELRSMLVKCTSKPLYVVFVGSTRSTDELVLLDELDRLARVEDGGQSCCHFLGWPDEGVDASLRTLQAAFAPLKPWYARLSGNDPRL